MSSVEEEDWTDSDSSTDYAVDRGDRGATSGTMSDPERSSEDAVTPQELPGEDGEQAGPLASVRRLNKCFTGATLNYQLPCTATECTTCQIAEHLSAWNKFLWLVSWQLREMPGTAGKLSLVILREPRTGCCLPQQQHEVIQRVWWLFKTHRCVAHVELGSSFHNQHHQVLLDAIRGSEFITSVKISSFEQRYDEALVSAVLSLPRLQVLEYGGYTAVVMTRLPIFLRCSTSLTALRLPSAHFDGLSSEDFFRALGQNSSLKELVLSSGTIAHAPPTAQAVFTESLKNSISLTSLTVADEFIGSIECILEGLCGSQSIRAVDVTCLRIGQADCQLISKIFEQNRVLQTFKIVSYIWLYSEWPYRQEHSAKADCDRCLKALIGNDTLEEVALPIQVWDEDQWKKLFEALPSKGNLQKVTIRATERASHRLVGRLCIALKGTGAEEKVSFDSPFDNEHLHEGFTCKAFSSVTVRATVHNRVTVCWLLERMPSLGHITSMDLDLCRSREEVRVQFSALATFLEATRSLRTLILSAWWDDSLYYCQETLFQGLAVNTSLRELRVKVKGISGNFSVFAEPLADTINASKNLSRVCFDTGEQRNAERAFFKRLSTGIADNYTLLSVGVPECSREESERWFWFYVSDTARRNSDLLTSAADFARGTRRDRHCALALERVHGHPELVEEVARLENIDKARATAMVRDGLRSMEGLDEFMRLAGVVKQRVSCHVCKDGRTQLDALNEDCWSAVTRYLKLRDIVDSTGVVPTR